ncbi:MAG: TonB-dependent receptor [Ignavibacteria bacterium]|jgi:outer membrane receptor protein involved in Fe transport
MRKFNTSLFAAILFFIIYGNYITAGTTGKIAGVIKDKNSGLVLPGANVLIEGTARGASTDSDGYYSFINLQPGIYTLTFKFIGYSTLTIENIEVSVDRTTRVDAELTEEGIEVAEVVVRAARPPVQKDRTYSASVVNSKTIESMPVTEVSEIIALQPGVVTSGGDLHFRGGREREVAYLIDGVPVTNSFDQGGGNNVVIENSMVQELEVISGTFNAEYGSAQSGIVNVVTKGIADRFRGSIKTYTGDWLSSNDDIYIGVDDFNPIAETDFQFSLAGPILQDRLGFSVSGRYNNNESLEWYERRYNPIDGWRIAAYQEWFQQQRSDELDATQGIPIPDSLKTGDGSKGPLAEYESYSLNAKLNWAPFQQVNLSYQIFGNFSETLGSTSSSRRYQPDEAGTSRSWSHHHFVTFKHFPSDKFFYNINFSYQHNDGESFYRKDNKVAQYPGDTGIQPISSSADDFSLGTTRGFWGGGDDKGYRDLFLINGSFNWQVDKYNFVKAGFEYKKHDIEIYNWGYTETEEWANSQWLYFDADPTLTYEMYWEIMTEYWKTWEDTYGTTKYRKYGEDETANYDDYKIEPVEIGAYIQDKVELGEIIINAGLRFDLFMPNERVPINFKTESYLLGTDENLTDASNKFQLSPRLGISFPISDRGVFHAAYGHFFQMPSFKKMYNEPLITLTSLQLEDRTLGNADLDPEKTIQYEIGLQQQITDNIAVDITAFYKDIRNLLGIENVTTVDAVGYQRFINRDYGNTKGFTVGLRKTAGFVTGAFNYTLSFANGSSSDPEEIQLIQTSTQIGGEAVEFIDRKILPLDWDQEHTLNLIVTFSQPGDWSLGFIGNLSSGQPYTPEFIEKYDILDVEFKNRANKPVQWNLDLKAKKFFQLGGLEYVLFLKVDNLFDNLNEDKVFASSGTADQNVRIPEDEELERERLSQEGHFTLEEIDAKPQWYTSPRKVQLGLEVYF